MAEVMLEEGVLEAEAVVEMMALEAEVVVVVKEAWEVWEGWTGSGSFDSLRKQSI